MTSHVSGPPHREGDGIRAPVRAVGLRQPARQDPQAADFYARSGNSTRQLTAAELLYVTFEVFAGKAGIDVRVP